MRDLILWSCLFVTVLLLIFVIVYGTKTWKELNAINGATQKKPDRHRGKRRKNTP